jgi:hypothetical protein
MPVHLGASWVQKVSKMRLGVVQTLPRIFRIFLEFILFFLELFLFIRRLYNLFHELQTLYLHSSCPNVSLGILLEFLWFFEYFSCSKNLFWCLLELFSHWKINSKKRKTYPSGTGRARGPDPLRPTRARFGPAWPAEAHRPQRPWPSRPVGVGTKYREPNRNLPNRNI